MHIRLHAESYCRTIVLLSHSYRKKRKEQYSVSFLSWWLREGREGGRSGLPSLSIGHPNSLSFHLSSVCFVVLQSHNPLLALHCQSSYRKNTTATPYPTDWVVDVSTLRKAVKQFIQSTLPKSTRTRPLKMSQFSTVEKAMAPRAIDEANDHHEEHIHWECFMPRHGFGGWLPPTSIVRAKYHPSSSTDTMICWPII